MLPRRWIILLILPVLILFGTLTGLKVYIEDKDRINSLLESIVVPFTGGDIEVGKVSIGFFSLRFSELEMNFPFNYFSLSADDIKISFSPLGLIQHRDDIVKSVESVILVKPLITIEESDFEPDNKIELDRIKSVFDLLPVRSILIRDGGIVYRNRDKDTIKFGESIHGSLKEETDALTLELRGRFAARKDNLFIESRLSLEGETNYFSVLLKEAEVKEPFQIGNVKVSGGRLKGLCEFTFTDSTGFSDISGNGSIELVDGAVNLGTRPDPVQNVVVNAFLDEETLFFTDILGNWRGMNITGSSVYSFKDPEKRRVDLKLGSVDISKFLVDMPESAVKLFSKKGDMDLCIRPDSGNTGLTVEASGGGFSIKDRVIDNFFLLCSVDENYAALDTFEINSERSVLRGKGMIDFEEKPLVYSFALNADAVLSEFTDKMAGGVSSSGYLHGMGNRLTYSSESRTNGMVFDSVEIPDIVFLNSGTNKNHMIKTASSDSGIMLEGMINEENDTGYMDIDIEAEDRMIDRFVLRYWPGASDQEFESGLSINLSNTLERPDVSGVFSLQNSALEGNIGISVTKFGKTVWGFHLNSDQLTWKGRTLHAGAEGVVSDDLIAFRKISLDEAVSADGRLRLGEESKYEFDVVVEDLGASDILKYFNSESEFSSRINGNVRITGVDSVYNYSGNCKVFSESFLGIDSVRSAFVFSGNREESRILPFVVREGISPVATLDTVVIDSGITLSGEFNGLRPWKEINRRLDTKGEINGVLSGRFYNTPDRRSVNLEVFSDSSGFRGFKFDSLYTLVKFTKDSLQVREMRAETNRGLMIDGSASLGYAFLTGDSETGDTAVGNVIVQGDLISAIENHADSPVKGTGYGSMELKFFLTEGDWSIRDSRMSINGGQLTLEPFLKEELREVNLDMSVDSGSNVHLYASCAAGKRENKVSLFTSHKLPSGFDPLILGSLDFGSLKLKTEEPGLDIHLVGFQKPGEYFRVMFEGKEPFEEFTLTGPAEELRLTGNWLLSNGEFTYPLLEEEVLEWEFDPFPYITWDMVLKPGGRRVRYYYDAVGKRRVIRFVECTVDPVSGIELSGRERDGTFRISGRVRSYKGSVFYGRTFDRNFRLGVDFVPEKGKDGYNNMPVIYGSAETFSDTSRLDRVKITLLTKDPETNALKERGRFNEISFKVSSDNTEVQEEVDEKFYKDVGLNFITAEGAGSMAAALGEEYIKRYFMQKIGKKLADAVGLDMINLETSIASNYFNHFTGEHDQQPGVLRDYWRYLTFGNIGVTVGRYFLRDQFFLKWRTELVQSDDMELSREHSLGLEYQPSPYFLLDGNIGFRKNEDEFIYNPSMRMLLRIPFGSTGAED